MYLAELNVCIEGLKSCYLQIVQISEVMMMMTGDDDVLVRSSLNF
jgi:hypothetical protein